MPAMIEQILDLHIHSKYSRACSKNLELSTIAKTCEIRGIDIVATGDFTHPKWFASIKDELVEAGEGLFQLKDQSSTTRFMLGTEVACIKKDGDQTRRVHLLLFAPSIETVERFNAVLLNRGFNLTSDGRPILGLTSKQLLEIMLEVDERMVMIPAHAWTPWFGILGSKGGYVSLTEAFGDLVGYIPAIETGLSSDPLMNARCSMLDSISLISNSDAHSPGKLGREANVMLFHDKADVTYTKIMEILRKKNKEEFAYTIEFYPEEGKCHMDGHRDCNVVFSPEETTKHQGICPVCRRPLVIGVMNRVSELADRTEEEARRALSIPYRSLVPLPEIIADTLGVGVASKKVQSLYSEMAQKIGTEFFILLHAPLDVIRDAISKEIADAIDRVRTGNIYIRPGYDGVFGVVKVFQDIEDRGQRKQLGMDLF